MNKPNTDRYFLVKRTNGKIDFAPNAQDAANEYTRRLKQQYSATGDAGEMTDQAELMQRSDFDVFERKLVTQDDVTVTGRPEPQEDTRALANSWAKRGRLLSDARALANEQKAAATRMLEELYRAGPADLATYQRIRRTLDDYLASQRRAQTRLDQVSRLSVPLAQSRREMASRINTWLTAQTLVRQLEYVERRHSLRTPVPEPLGDPATWPGFPDPALFPNVEPRDGFWKIEQPPGSDTWVRIPDPNNRDVKAARKQFQSFANRQLGLADDADPGAETDVAYTQVRMRNLLFMLARSRQTQPTPIPAATGVASSAAATGRADLDASRYEPTGFPLQSDTYECLQSQGENGMPGFPGNEVDQTADNSQTQRRGIVVITMKHTLFAKVFHPFTPTWKARNDPAFLAQEIEGSGANEASPQEAMDYDDFMKWVAPFRLAGTRVMMVVSHVPFWLDNVDGKPDSDLTPAELTPLGGIGLMRKRKLYCGIYRIDSNHELSGKRGDVQRCPPGPSGPFEPGEVLDPRYGGERSTAKSGHECDATRLPPGPARNAVQRHLGQYAGKLYSRSFEESMLILMDPAETPIRNPTALTAKQGGGGGEWNALELRRKVQDTAINLVGGGAAADPYWQRLYQKLTHTMKPEDDDPPDADWTNTLVQDPRVAVDLADNGQPINCRFDTLQSYGNQTSAFDPNPNYHPYNGHTFTEEDDVISSLVMHELNNQSGANWNHAGANAMARFHGYSSDLGYFKSLPELDYFKQAMSFVAGPNQRPGAVNTTDTRGAPAPFYGCHIYWLDAFMHGPDVARDEFPNSLHWERYEKEQVDARENAAAFRDVAGGEPELYARVSDDRVANQIRAAQIRGLWKLLNMLVTREYVLPEAPERAKSEGSTSTSTPPPARRSASAPAKLSSQPWLYADDVPPEVEDVVFDHYLADEKYDVTTPDYVRIYALDAIARRAWANVAKLSRDDRPWRTMDDVPDFFRLNVERRTERALRDMSILGGQEARVFVPGVYPPAQWILYTDVNLILDRALVEARYVELLANASPQGLASPVTVEMERLLQNQAAQQMWKELYGAGGIFEEQLVGVPPVVLIGDEEAAKATSDLITAARAYMDVAAQS